jgi:hypothetical protein
MAFLISPNQYIGMDEKILNRIVSAFYCQFQAFMVR